MTGPVRSTLFLGMVAMLALGPTPARAVDGCLVLLCLASGDWRSIAQCVDPVQQVLSDLRRGRPFPRCSFSGAGNDARHDWATAPANCPPQYTHVVQSEAGPLTYFCDYSGVIAVRIDGAAWSNVWWAWDGGTVSEYTPAAKQQLGTWNTKFDDDYDAWLAAQP